MVELNMGLASWGLGAIVRAFETRLPVSKTGSYPLATFATIGTKMVLPWTTWRTQPGLAFHPAICHHGFGNKPSLWEEPQLNRFLTEPEWRPETTTAVDKRL